MRQWKVRTGYEREILKKTKRPFEITEQTKMDISMINSLPTNKYK